MVPQTVPGGAAGIGCIIVTTAGISLIAASAAPVEQHGTAGQYNMLTKTFIESEGGVGEGRYFLTPASKLFKFKRTLQALDFTAAASVDEDAQGGGPIACLSSEGISVVVQATSQFVVEADHLVR